MHKGLRHKTNSNTPRADKQGKLNSVQTMSIRGITPRKSLASIANKIKRNGNGGKSRAFDPCEMYTTLCKLNPNKEELKTDAQRVISLFLKRGGNIDTIIQKTSDIKKKKKIEAVKQKYDIKPNVSDGQHVITMARIAACFPQYTIATLRGVSDKKLNRPIDVDIMRNISPGYPKVLMTTIVSSVLPLGMTEINKQLLFKAICLYCVLEQKKINKKFKNEKYSVIAKDCFKYISLYYDYKLMNEDERVAFCKSEAMNEVFLVGEKGTLIIKSVIHTASTAFEKLLKNN